MTKCALAQSLGIARSSLYDVSLKEQSDWKLKTAIEEVLREHHTYGSRNIALALHRNRKCVQRVMRKYGTKPYRRRGRKWRKTRKISIVYPNLLSTTPPQYPHHIWASDFTELWYKTTRIYVATVEDLYTRTVIGIAVSLRKGTPLTLQALYTALNAYPRPTIFHSDNGREYDALVFTKTLEELKTFISRSHPGCPWENGYQESFYDKFKLTLGDPNRFRSLGELVAAVYQTIWTYNHTRIHSALKKPPMVFARQYRRAVESYQMSV